MARVLIGWELGGGRGHIVNLFAISAPLQAAGHDVAIAVQRYEALPPDLPPGLAMFQAPVWPGLFSNFVKPPWRRAATMIDILARLGLTRERTLKHLLLGWDAILQTFKPDIVIGDHAPALLVAANGRVPAIACGSGFQVPPSGLGTVSRFTSSEPGFDENAMLDLIDADLREAGRPPLNSLASFFDHTRSVIATFPELDPFRRSDGPDFVAPMAGDWCKPAAEPGSEVFVYMGGPIQEIEDLWRGLAASGLAVRAHLAIADNELKRKIRSHGIILENQALPWTDIARRSRVAITHGAHGTMCAAMLAGIPQLTLPIDLEKRLNSEALARLGLGRWHDPNVFKPDGLTEEVRALHADETLLAAAREAAPRFAARMTPDFGTSVLRVVEDLL